MDIPGWSKRYLQAESAQLIEEAVKAAEMKTAGEIVPMVVRRSSTVGHIPLVLMSLMVAIFMIVDGAGWQYENLLAHWAWYLVDTLGLLVLAAMLAKIPFFQRILTPRDDQVAQVNMRAQIEFYESNINKTSEATGVLLFVSLMERQAIVLADKAIHDRVSSETWEEVCDLMIQGIKKGHLEWGFISAIERCGEILAVEFPIDPDDVNELRDTLVIKE